MILPAAATFSKDWRMFLGEGNQPFFIDHGKGAYLYGTDGNKYLDWICALGANILGYADDRWVSAIIKEVVKGTSFPLQTRLEYEVAELLVNTLKPRVPGWADKSLGVRFLKTGTECTNAAIRLARAVTGRDLIFKCRQSYLGWADWWIVTTPPAHGIPKDIAYHVDQFDFNDDEFFEANYTKAACVILEQGLEDPNNNFYSAMRRFCDRTGALLILDETASGFRYALGGAAECFNIMPDLATYGKALGNGVSIAALVGHSEYMDWFGRRDPVFVSGTFFGETTGLAGAKVVLETLTETSISHLWNVGLGLMKELQIRFKMTPIKVVGHPCRFILQWPNDQWHAYVVRSMLEHFILLNRPNMTTLAHTMDDVMLTSNAAQDLVRDWQRNGLPEYKEEELPMVLFRNR